MEPVPGQSPSWHRLEALYRGHYGELLRFAARRVDPETARDVISEVFVVAWRRIEEVPRRHPRAWLFGVARFVLANEVRAQGRRDNLITAASDLFPTYEPDVADGIATNASARWLLAQLSETDRELLMLTEQDGLSPSEAARVLNCSAATARVRLSRARRRLRALYDRSTHDAQSDYAAPTPGAETARS